jgi:hypothetical protein
LSSKARIKQAIEALEDFTGMDAKNVEVLQTDEKCVYFEIGDVDGILYTTERDGEIESYIHEFKEKARPQLIASYDGQELRIIGGRFDFTERGIVDRV